MSKKNKVAKPARSAVKAVGKSVVSQNSREQNPKRFLRRATALHCFTFITCFSLFILLSFRLANQPLMESRPLQANGWIMVNDPETGKPVKTEFSCPINIACELAQMFDEIPNTAASAKLEKYGEINFLFTKKRAARKFFVAQDGIRDSQGWYRHKDISPDKVRTLILNGMMKENQITETNENRTDDSSPVQSVEEAPTVE